MLVRNISIVPLAIGTSRTAILKAVSPETYRYYASTTVNAPSPKEQLDHFHSYYSTKKSLRPFIYRSKNALSLLSKDLKDPKTGETLKPKRPVVPINSEVLNQYIKSIPEGSNDLVKWFQEWTSLNYRKRPVWNYILPSHVQNMLISSYSHIGHYGYLLSALYATRRNFTLAGNSKIFDVDHFFNSIILCNIHRNEVFDYGKNTNITIKKLKNAWSNTIIREEDVKSKGITKLLLQSLSKQANIDALEIVPHFKNAEIVKLPKLSDESKLGYLTFKKNKYLYIQCRTIKQFDNAASEIDEFINNFQKLEQKLQLQDVYDEFVASGKNLYTKLHNERENKTKPEATA